MSPALGVYALAARVAHPFAPALLAARARRGKEDRARLGERLGNPQLMRPRGPLLWLHAASVGETGVALALADRIRVHAPELKVLLTTMTRTAASLAGAKLAAGDVHQFAPVDTPQAAARFLNHWRPDAGVFLESELWPNLLAAARRRAVPLCLVNARMSARSLAGWARWPRAAQALLHTFSFIHAADQATAAGLTGLGGVVAPDPINLKLAALPAAPPAQSLAGLCAAMRSRPSWIAASTHPGEEEIALAAHRLLLLRHPDALLVLAPRHPERGEAVAELAGGAPRRSRQEQPHEAPVYILDSIGELAGLFSAAPAALIGASLTPDGRGHNPCEALAQGAGVISGPHVSSFADVYAALDSAGAILWASDAPTLAAAVAARWTAPAGASPAGQALRAAALQRMAEVAANVAALVPEQGGADAAA